MTKTTATTYQPLNSRSGHRLPSYGVLGNNLSSTHGLNTTWTATALAVQDTCQPRDNLNIHHLPSKLQAGRQVVRQRCNTQQQGTSCCTHTHPTDHHPQSLPAPSHMICPTMLLGTQPVDTVTSQMLQHCAGRETAAAAAAAPTRQLLLSRLLLYLLPAPTPAAASVCWVGRLLPLRLR